MYISAVPDWPFCSRLIFSSAKEEKVVNPPQNPDASSRYPVGCSHWLRAKRPNNMPMISEPVILIRKVATGNGCIRYLLTIKLTPNRAMLPAAPPAPTNKKSLNIVSIQNSKVKIQSIHSNSKMRFIWQMYSRQLRTANCKLPIIPPNRRQTHWYHGRRHYCG
jgi:hypothetical protein